GGGTLPNGEKSLPDQVISNTSTQRLIDAAGLRRICALGANPGPSGFVNFVFGAHQSVFDPASSPAATAEMRREATIFANTMGRIVQITDQTVVQTGDCSSSASGTQAGRVHIGTEGIGPWRPASGASSP
ncbi:MAG: lipase, partial [Gammaproteobacteria bacterium]|nr:lipase [Gammaproteobacteria bacterium]